MNSTNYSPIIEAFKKQAADRPDCIALLSAGQVISYKQLDDLVGRVIRQLLVHHQRPGVIAAVDIQSPPVMVSSVMAILALSGMVMPIDLSKPRQVVTDQLERSGADWLLTDHYQKKDFKFTGRILALDKLREPADDTPGEPDKQKIGNPGFLMYTSHSSGFPQGVVLSQEKILNWLTFNIQTLKIDFNQCLFIATPVMMERFPLWLASLFTGGSVRFYEKAYNKPDGDPDISSLLEEGDISSIVCPLHQLEEILPARWWEKADAGKIKNIVTTGEECFDAETLKNNLSTYHIRWHNYFGFPEINMVTTLKGGHSGQDGDFTHMGKPTPGTSAYILNQAKQQVAVGLQGDLYLSGSGVMDGYHRNERLNRSDFFENPFKPSGKMYNTGYLASWSKDGKISLSDRSDDLLTVNGQRISQKEVERVLLKNPLIEDAAVVEGGLDRGRSRLTAFLVLKEEGIFWEKIDEALRNYLPGEIFPVGLIEISSLPRTPEGKLDKDYLKECNFLDSVQLKSIENAVKQETNIFQAAVVSSEKFDRPAPLHLRDLIPVTRPESNEREEVTESADSPADISTMSHDLTTEVAIIHEREIAPSHDGPQTLAEALLRASARYGDNGIIYIQPDGTDRFQSYDSLLTEAQRVLKGLKKIGLKPGDKVIFQFDRCEDFVSAFWGCELGGFIPVPMMVPRSLQKASNETATLLGVWNTLERPLVLCSVDLTPALKGFFRDFRIESIDNLRENDPDQEWHRSDPEDLAILLFTSGSTGKPKGVQQCHRAILGREKGTIRHNDFHSSDISLNWMPLEHVGGVVMFHVRDIYCGCKQIQVRTEYILAEPLRWLDIISRYRATITWAPNFAYALINDRIGSGPDDSDGRERDWDLSSMRFILNGGEAINAGSTRKFLTLLGPYGLPLTSMKPAWGMSETCSGVVYSHTFTVEPETGVHHIDKYSLGGNIKISTEEANRVTFVELGEPIPGISIRVTDSRNRLVSQGVVGHLQIKGVSVTSGYYRNPELNQEVFSADGWFDTGDLGFILDGRMTITGRAKDVIIVNGINLNSVEIEAAIEELDGVETSFTAACAVRDEEAETDRIVIFYSSKFSDFSRQLLQISQIKRRFAETFGMNLDYVVPIAREDVPKTSIGKIQRTRLGKMFEAGDYEHIVKKIDIGLENENTLPSWFFSRFWLKKNLSMVETGSAKQTCLVFENDNGLGNELISKLRSHQCRTIRVKAAGEFKKVGLDLYEMSYKEPEDFLRLFNGFAEENIEIDVIFHLTSTSELKKESEVTHRDEIKIITEAQHRGVYSLMALIQALNNRFENRLTKLYVVSSRAQFTSEDQRAAIEKCTLQGFLKCAALELPWLEFFHVDLEGDDNSRNAGFLVREWQHVSHDREVAYRRGERLVPCLLPVEVKPEKLDVPLKKGGVYLVTGGLGGIGIHVCRWLIQNWQAKLILVGRTALPMGEEQDGTSPEDIVYKKRLKAYREIEAGGGDFVYIAGDVADVSFLQEVVRRAASRWGGALDGIFHLAGDFNLEYHWAVMDRHRIVSEMPSAFENIFRSKVYGTVALHQLVKDNPEAVFVAFSSTTSFFGASTFAAYAAANSFLDSFCLDRRCNGYPNTFCLNWSSWDNIGMTENNPPHMVQAMRSSGYEMINPRRGLASLRVGLGHPGPTGQLLIGLNSSKRNIRRFLGNNPASRQLVKIYYLLKQGTNLSQKDLLDFVFDQIEGLDKNEKIILRLESLDKMPMEAGGIDYLRLLELESDSHFSSLESGRPETETELRLATIWRQLLDKDQIGVNDDFFQLGGHSLKATILAARLQKEFRCTVPLKEIFKNPTIEGLARYLETAMEVGYRDINPVEKKEFYSLSPSQQRFYILQQLDTGMTNYNIPAAFILIGRLDMGKLTATFGELIRRHEGLRTAFEKPVEVPVQRIYHDVEFSIEYDDFSRAGINAETAVRKFIRPFDLAKAPLLRVGVIRSGMDENLLMVDMHHIAADGVSIGLLINEFIRLYSGEELPPLEIQYRDFSEWQKKLLESGELGRQREFWMKEYSGKLPVLGLPTDYERPVKSRYTGYFINFELPGEEVQKLTDFARTCDTTLFMVLLSVFCIMLAKLSGQDDIIVGTALAGRRHPALEPVIGLFLNTLALRNYPAGKKTFETFLGEVRERTLEAYENQDYPFEEIVAGVVDKRFAGQQPIFNVMFGLQNIEMTELNIPGLHIRPYRFHTRTCKFDMIMLGSDQDDRLLFNIEYNTELFKHETIENFAEYYKTILSTVLADPQIRIDEISIISAEETREIMKEILEDQSEEEAEFDI